MSILSRSSKRFKPWYACCWPNDNALGMNEVRGQAVAHSSLLVDFLVRWEREKQEFREINTLNSGKSGRI